VPDDNFTIELTRDQALMLSDWLYRMIGTDRFDALVDENPAVWSPLHTISGALETTRPEVFAPDYSARLNAARGRLLAALGDGFLDDVAEKRSRRAAAQDGERI